MTKNSSETTDSPLDLGICYSCGRDLTDCLTDRWDDDPIGDGWHRCSRATYARPLVPLGWTGETGVAGFVEELPDVLMLRASLQAAEYATWSANEAVKRMRAHGWSWERIGNVLGVTRQAAQQRYGRR
jgi:hypothetical protein